MQSPHELLLFLQNCRQRKKTSEQWIVTTYNKDKNLRNAALLKLSKCMSINFLGEWLVNHEIIAEHILDH
jgi:hypothetical protein